MSKKVLKKQNNIDPRLIEPTKHSQAFLIKEILPTHKTNFMIKLFIFLIWFLVKLGDFGIGFGVFTKDVIIYIVLSPFKTIFFISGLISKLFHVAFKTNKQSVLFGLVAVKKHRGRPNHQPLLVRLLRPVRKLFVRVFPSKIRIAMLIMVLFGTFFVYSIGLIIVAHQLPSPQTLNSSNSPLTTQIFDRNGKLLYRIYDGKNRSLIEIDQLPKDLVNATIAIEDKNFWAHPGVDLYGITRAGVNFFKGGDLQGGSTITQQLIKNTLLTPERTWQRKMKEIVLAFWAERIFTKKDILQMYFNEVPYGGPAWGIAAAAETYFHKDVKDLNLAEASYLAGLPVSPTTFSPYGSHPEMAKNRQKEVLRRMVEEGYITSGQADEAFNTPLDIKPKIEEIKAAHFVMYVRAHLSEKYGEKMVSQGGLQVTTSLDLDIQQMAEEIVESEVDKLATLKATNGAAMVTDAKTGQILAMVGSKNYWDDKGGNFNVTTSIRQPGSSIKPITYAASFKEGFTPASMILDTPISYKNAWENYSPVNYDGRFHGPVTIRTALGSSYNIPAVKVLNEIGVNKLIQTAKDLGITTFTTPERYGLSLTLGGAEVKMVDMMSVYGTFSQLGKKYDIQPIVKITDSKGVVLEDNSQPSSKKVLESGVAYMISNILSDNKARIPAFGPNSLLVIPGHTVAVKTGTTDSKRDNWTFGYTPDFVVGTWVGNNDNSPMDPQLTSGVSGASPIWHQIMVKLLENKPDVAFAKPSDINEALINGRKDLVLVGKEGKRTLSTEKNYAQSSAKPQVNGQNITFTDPLNTYITNTSSQ
jgi:1A family penicillin-binding protein